MPTVLQISDLRDALQANYSRAVLNQSKILRKFNIDAFFSISRNGLRFGELEHRIQLYSTFKNEKIYIQFPGKESVPATSMPYDFRPKIKNVNGCILPDFSFGDIWDALENISRSHNEYLAIVAALFFRMGYMYDYAMTESNYECTTLKIDGSDSREVKKQTMPLSWYCLDFPEDVWFSLNNYIGDVEVTDELTISFEAFVKFIDLLVQNEDCKYYYRNVKIKGKENYNLGNGRTPTCDANLLIIEYLKRESHLSNLLDSFQKSRGVPKFIKSRYPAVTDGIITNV